jgi:hypothetical protein
MKTQPLTVFDDSLWGDRVSNPRELQLGQLLWEPREGTPEWCPAVVRRLIAAYSAPVAVGVKGPGAARLEAAGWFSIGEDADADKARASCWPLAADVHKLSLGVGSLSPLLVLVGLQDKHAQAIPFLSKTGNWMFGALRRLGYDELTLHVLNLRDASGRRRLKKTKALYNLFKTVTDPTWIALDVGVSEDLSDLSIPHVRVQNPSWHRRYHASEGVEGYANRFKRSGVHAYESPFVPLPVRDGLPELPAPYDVMSASYKRGATPKSATRRSTTVPPHKAEQARRAFVTGEVDSVREAARRFRTHESKLYRVAREQDWEGERRAYQQQVTEKTKEAAGNAEAKSAANSRKLAWAATELALAHVTKALKDGTLKPKPLDAKILADTAMALSDRVVDPTTAQKELRGQTLVELVEQVNEKIAKNLGGGT